MFKQLSQFWYDDGTAEKLTDEIFSAIPKGGKIALIGCPSLYYFVKKRANDSTVGNAFLAFDYNSDLLNFEMHIDFLILQLNFSISMNGS